MEMTRFGSLLILCAACGTFLVGGLLWGVCSVGQINVIGPDGTCTSPPTVSLSTADPGYECYCTVFYSASSNNLVQTSFESVCNLNVVTIGSGIGWSYSGYQSTCDTQQC